jgi:hypothetical protein
MTTTGQRIVGLVVLLVAGILSLPLAAYFLDGQATENWIVPFQLLAMSLIGATVTVALPALARVDAQAPHRALPGVWWGLLTAFLGIALFWFLLNGFRGA